MGHAVLHALVVVWHGGCCGGCGRGGRCGTALRLPGHDVRMAAWERAHGLVCLAPGLGSGQGVHQRWLRWHGRVGQGSGGCIGAGSVGCRWALGLRQQGRQQGETSQSHGPRWPGRRRGEKNSRGAHGDLQTTNEKTRRCRPMGPVSRGQSGNGRRTSGVGDQAMGGLMASAAGALSNCAEARGSRALAGRGAGVSDAGRPSMAEWQISQAEQLALWWSWSL